MEMAFNAYMCSVSRKNGGEAFISTIRTYTEQLDNHKTIIYGTAFQCIHVQCYPRRSIGNELPLPLLLLVQLLHVELDERLLLLLCQQRLPAT